MNTDRMISAEAAIQVAADIVRECAVRGMRPFDVSRGGYLNLEFKRAWAVSCDLSIRLSSGDRRPVLDRRGREVVAYAWVQRPIVEVCWSSTGRNVAAATAALALYREVTELAALIEVAPRRGDDRLPRRRHRQRRGCAMNTPLAARTRTTRTPNQSIVLLGRGERPMLLPGDVRLSPRAHL